MSSNFGGIPPLTSELAVPLFYHSRAFIFDWIFFIFADNNDNNIVSNEFEIRPDPTMDCGVIALDQFKKNLLENYSKYFDDLLSGERSLPFGLLVLMFRNLLKYILYGYSLE